jgi:hypothetical protein
MVIVVDWEDLFELRDLSELPRDLSRGKSLKNKEGFNPE